MAHFAEIKDGLVGQILVIANEDCGGGDFPNSEPIGQAFIASLGLEGEWLQTSFNNNFRGTYAGIGYTYDPATQDFIAPPAPEPLIEE
jgi:hypothetical protein